MSNLNPKSDVERNRLPCVVLVLAGNALKEYGAVERPSPEYYLLRFVVHAGLAKIVHGIGWILRCGKGQNKYPLLAKLVQAVLGPVSPLLLKLSNLCTKLACLVFERLDFIASRRLFFLELQRGVLDINDPIVERLCGLGQLRIIAQGDCRARQVDGCFQGTKGGADCGYDHGSSSLQGDVGDMKTSNSTGGRHSPCQNPNPRYSKR